MRKSRKTRKRHFSCQIPELFWLTDCESTIVSLDILKWMLFQLFPSSAVRGGQYDSTKYCTLAPGMITDTRVPL